MTTESVTLGPAAYPIWLGLLLAARGADLLSTWIATPNLTLEGNPVAQRLGWRGGLVVNGLACVVCALLEVAAVIVITTSLLVAARNFQWAWLMRSWGEEAYRQWYGGQLRATPLGLYLVCLVGQCLLFASLGAGLMAFSRSDSIPFAVGIGMIVYAVAVLLYSGLAVSRIRRG